MCIHIIFRQILLTWHCRDSWGESLSLVEEVTLVPEGFKAMADGKQLPLCCSNESSLRPGKCHPPVVTAEMLDFTLPKKTL